MSLASRIASKRRTPTATVRIGGRRWSRVLSLSREQSYGQGMSGGTVVGRDPPVTITEGETTISWTWGYDGYEVAGFTGVVAKILQRSYPNQWSLQVADPLWFANIRRSDIATDPLNNIAASTAIGQILDAAGVTRMNIPTLSASGSEWVGSEWVLGTLTPVSWTNTTALAAAQEICACLGYWLYCDASGVARATLMERRPSDAPFRTLRWGEDFLLAGPPDRERDASTVKNRIVVRGANTGVQGAQIWDEWTTGDGDRSQEFSSFLIEYVNEAEAGNASATAIAKRLLRLWSRRPNVVRIGRLKADPRLCVGMTVAVECDLIGYTSATPLFIYGLNTSLDLTRGEFVQSLVLDGGTGTQGYTTVPAPEASFTWTIITQTLDGSAVVEVLLDGSGSLALDGGEIVTYAWSTSTTTYGGTQTTASGAQAMFAYPGATTEATVTLTVTGTNSKIGTLTQVIPLVGDALTTPVSDVLSVAFGSAWEATPDGGATWNEEASGDSTIVPRSGDTRLYSTRASGSTGVRGSDDVLSGASTSLASLGGAITAMSATPNTDRVWAAVGTALYRSTDKGATFALWGTLPSSINDILEDPAVVSSVFVLAGANMYHATTETPGSSWTILYAGPTGATARYLVRGQSGATTWICYTGTFTGSPLQRVEGPITALFDPQPDEIRAIALSDDEQTVYAWDGDGLGWTVDNATGVATANGADLGAGETAQDAAMSEYAPIVYLATFGATEGTIYKYLPLLDAAALFTFYTPASGRQAHRIGVGGPGVLNDVELLMTTYGVSGGGVYHKPVGTSLWTLKSTGLPSGWYWWTVSVDPFNPDRWLLFGTADSTGGFAPAGGVYKSGGEHIVWITEDAGATWTACPITAHSSADGQIGGSQGTAQGIAWSATTGGSWIGIGHVPATANPAFVIRGTTTSAASTALTGEPNIVAQLGTPGQSDEVVFSTSNDFGRTPYLYYLQSGSVATNRPSGSSISTPQTRLVRRSSDRAVALIVNGGVWATSDYRAAQPTSRSITAQGIVFVGARVFIGVANGIEEVTDLLGSPSTAAVYAQTSVAPTQLQASGTAIAGRSNPSSSRNVVISADGGDSWREIEGPSALSPSEAFALAVINRGVAS